MSFYSDHDHLGDPADPCREVLTRKDGSSYVCGRPASSAVHPPDQYRHWCSALEAGADCVHFEETD